MSHEDGIQTLRKKFQRTMTQQVKLYRFPDTKSSSSFIRMKRKRTVLCGSLYRVRCSSPNILKYSDWFFITNVRAMPGQTQAPSTPKSRTTTLQSIYGCFRHIMWQRGISWRLIKWLPWRFVFSGCVAAAGWYTHGPVIKKGARNPAQDFREGADRNSYCWWEKWALDYFYSLY